MSSALTAKAMSPQKTVVSRISAISTKYTALRDLGRHLLVLVSRTDRLALERLDRPQPAVEAVSHELCRTYGVESVLTVHGGPARRGTAHGRVGVCRVDRRFSLGFRRSSTYGKARWRAPMCTDPPVRTWERAINLEDSCETAESQQKSAPFLSDCLSPMCVSPSPGRESLPHPHPGTDRPAAHSRGSRSGCGAERPGHRRCFPSA